jgi:hypothetical protein
MRIRKIKTEILVQKEKRRDDWVPSPYTNSCTIHVPFGLRIPSNIDKNPEKRRQVVRI